MISTARHVLFRPGTSPHNFAALRRRAAGKSQQKIRVRAKTKATAKEGGKEADDEWIGGEVKSNVVPKNPSLDSANAPEYMHGVLAFNRFYPENARGCAFNRHLVVALVRCVLDTFLCVSLLGVFPISSSLKSRHRIKASRRARKSRSGSSITSTARAIWFTSLIPTNLGGKVSLCIVYFCFRLRARASRRMGVGDPSVRAGDDLVHKGNFSRRKSPGNDYQKK